MLDGKAYYAAATFRGTQGRVYVEDTSGHSRPLEHHPYHSPDGHAWGYGGSGPSELAKDILWDVLGRRPQGVLYQEFKWAFIANLDQDAGWRIYETTIRAWLATRPPAQLETVL